MKKFRVKTSEQTLGPFYKYQIEDLVRKGRISEFEIQEFPSGDWFDFDKHPDFIKKETNTDATFVRRLDSIKKETGLLLPNIPQCGMLLKHNL